EAGVEDNARGVDHPPERRPRERRRRALDLGEEAVAGRAARRAPRRAAAVPAREDPLARARDRRPHRPRDELARVPLEDRPEPRIAEDLVDRRQLTEPQERPRILGGGHVLTSRKSSARTGSPTRTAPSSRRSAFAT